MRVIAECGVNWRSFDEARLMIQKAKDAGCWAAKFQLFTKKEAPNLPEHLYLSHGQAEMLFDTGKHEVGIEVFFTPMFLEAVDWCEQIGVNYYKIRYTDRHNKKLLKKIRKTKKFTMISMNLEEIKKKYKNFLWYLPLFCVPKYPADLYDYYQGWLFDGYSDHTPDLTLLKDMFSMPWIKVFEKHVKLDENCIESAWSVTFEQLKEVLK